MTATDGNGSIIWWLCYLPPDDPIYDVISGIGEALTKNGQRLIVFGPSADFSRYNGFIHFGFPFSLVEQGRKWKNFVGSSFMPMSVTSYPELVAAEEGWCGGPLSDGSELLIIRSLAFWEKAAEMMRPSLILSWGTTAPFSRAILRIAQCTQTPSYAVERGIIESTLMFNLVGQCFLSNIGMRPQYVGPMRSEAVVDREWDKITAYYRGNSDTNYKDHNARRFLRTDNNGRKSVLYLGAFDLGSGIAFSNPRCGDRLGGWVTSSSFGLEKVAEQLSRVAPDATLRVKLHPGSPYNLDGLSSRFGLNISEHSTTDFRDLVAESDVIITPISSTQTYGFIYDKPIVTLGNSFFSGRDIVYECTDEDELGVAISDALERKGWSEKYFKAKQLLTTLFREELIGLNDNVPTLMKRGDLIAHLGHFKRYYAPGGLTAEERIEGFLEFSSFSTGVTDLVGIQTLESMLGSDAWQRMLHEMKDEATIGFDEVLTGLRDEIELLRHQLSSKDELIIALTEERRLAFEHAEIISHQLQSELIERSQYYAKELQVERAEKAVLLKDRQEVVAKNLELRARINEFKLLVSSTEDRVSKLEQQLSETKSRLGEAEAEFRVSSEHIENLRIWARNSVANRTKYDRSAIHGWFKRDVAPESIPNLIDYLLKNPDLVLAGADPLRHWLKYGMYEARDLGRSK